MDNISELLTQVPRAPEDSIPQGVSNEQLAQLELRIGMTLPNMLKDWLKLTNGPCIGPGGFYGITPDRVYLDIEEHLRRFPEWIERMWIPIAGDGCGNYYVLSTMCEFGPGLPVFFIDIEQDSTLPSYIVASDLNHFILAVLRKEMGESGWPFDKNITLFFDPNIVCFHGVSFAWDRG